LRSFLSPHFDIGMARTTDIDLVNRVARANAFNPDLVISVHVNGGGGTGVETVIPTASPNNPNRDLLENHFLAQNMSLALGNHFKMRVRRAKGVMLETETRHDFIGILRQTNAIAILPEIGFIDAPSGTPDIDILRHRQIEIAQVMSGVIFEWFGISKKKDEVIELRYNTIQEIAEMRNGQHFVPTILKMVDRKILSGSGSDENGNVQGLNLSEDMIRVFVTNDRSGLYGK
jgi:hypothetical protein